MADLPHIYKLFPPLQGLCVNKWPKICTQVIKKDKYQIWNCLYVDFASSSWNQSLINSEALTDNIEMHARCIVDCLKCAIWATQTYHFLKEETHRHEEFLLPTGRKGHSWDSRIVDSTMWYIKSTGRVPEPFPQTPHIDTPENLLNSVINPLHFLIEH